MTMASNPIEFSEQPSKEYFCRITGIFLSEPYLTECCGEHISRETFEQFRGKACPIPGCEHEPLVAMKDKFLERKAMSLVVKCSHKASGCDWEGKLQCLKQHEADECQYVQIGCPYACGERVSKQGLEQHQSQCCPMRPFTCQYCNYNANYREITESHWPLCQNYPVPCPNNCGEEKIERKEVDSHLKNACPLEVIECEFSFAGCGAQMQRQIMSKHMEDSVGKHLSTLSAYLKEPTAHRQSNALQGEDQAGKSRQVEDEMSDKMKHLEDKLEKQGEQMKQQQVKIELQEKRTEQQREFIKQQEDQIKQMKDLLEQHSDQIKQQRELITEQSDQIKQQREKIEKELVEQQESQQTNGQVEDLVKQQEEQLTALTKMLQKKINIFPMEQITFDNFQERKKKGEEWYSQPFYSQIGGYKMCLRVDANGFAFGKGSHVSVMVYLMKGEFDHLLEWPFHGEVTVQLLSMASDGQPLEKKFVFDEKAPREIINKPVNDRNSSGKGEVKFLAHSAIGGYLKSKTLLFNISDIVIKS